MKLVGKPALVQGRSVYHSWVDLACRSIRPLVEGEFTRYRMLVYLVSTRPAYTEPVPAFNV